MRIIRDWARKQTTFRLYSSSVLLVYDAAQLGQCGDSALQRNTSLNASNGQTAAPLSVKARMIDFAHAFPADASEAGTVDDNYLQGVESLVGLFEQFLAAEGNVD